MRRVLFLLDVTEAEAAHIVEAVEPVSPELKGFGITEAFATAKSMTPSDAQAFQVQLRSAASAKLGGPDAKVIRDESAA